MNLARLCPHRLGTRLARLLPTVWFAAAVACSDSTAPQADPPLDSLMVSPTRVTLVAGDTVWFQLQARPYYYTGWRSRPCGELVRVSDTTVAAVTGADCLDRVNVVALRPGSVGVIAALGGRADTATLRVVAPYAFTSVSSSGGDACALTDAGSAVCWGGYALGWDSNDDDCLTCEQSRPRVPVRGGLVFASLSAGRYATCGLTSTGAAYCWGRGYGVSPVAVPGGLAFTTVSVGFVHACGLTTDGAAYCWGGNADGQLGNGGTDSSGVPVPASGVLRLASIGAGERSTCALSTGGDAYCWGANGDGELGTGDKLASAVPKRVAGGLAFSALSVGPHHACGLASGGAAYCWGRNANAQLGVAPILDSTCTSLYCSSAPVAVNGLFGFREISLSVVTSCGLTGSGTGFCWGLLFDHEDQGSCGSNPPCFGVWYWVNQDTPRQVPGTTRFTAATAGGSYWMGADGRVYSWFPSLTGVPGLVPGQR